MPSPYSMTADLEIREATRLGCDLYGALARHDLLDAYREHGGIVGVAYADPSMPICALVPQSLGALVRIGRQTSKRFRLEELHGWICRINQCAGDIDDTPEHAVARALLLALGCGHD